VVKLLVTIVVAVLTGCDSTPEEYFSHNKVGSGIDFAVMKNGDDHVITVHGFVDDYDTCKEIVVMLETKGGSYTCSALN